MFLIARRERVIARRDRVRVPPTAVTVLNPYLAAAQVADNLLCPRFRFPLRGEDVAWLLSRSTHCPSVRMAYHVSVILHHRAPRSRLLERIFRYHSPWGIV